MLAPIPACEKWLRRTIQCDFHGTSVLTAAALSGGTATIVGGGLTVARHSEQADKPAYAFVSPVSGDWIARHATATVPAVTVH